MSTNLCQQLTSHDSYVHIVTPIVSPVYDLILQGMIYILYVLTFICIHINEAWRNVFFHAQSQDYNYDNRRNALKLVPKPCNKKNIDTLIQILVHFDRGHIKDIDDCVED